MAMSYLNNIKNMLLKKALNGCSGNVAFMFPFDKKDFFLGFCNEHLLEILTILVRVELDLVYSIYIYIYVK